MVEEEERVLIVDDVSRGWECCHVLVDFCGYALVQNGPAYGITCFMWKAHLSDFDKCKHACEFISPLIYANSSLLEIYLPKLFHSPRKHQPSASTAQLRGTYTKNWLTKTKTSNIYNKKLKSKS